MGRPRRDRSRTIADEQRLVRTGFRVIVGAADGIEVVGEAADGVEAVERAVALAPDVVLMDIRMPRLDGLQATRMVRARTSVRVLILTTFDSDEYVYEALRSGAGGFPAQGRAGRATDRSHPRRGRRRRAHRSRGDPAADRQVHPGAATGRAAGRCGARQLAGLTARELDVLRLVAAGLSNHEIAARLGVEDSTVKTHVGRVLTKLGLRDRVQAVVLAYETGLVVPDDRVS